MLIRHNVIKMLRCSSVPTNLESGRVGSLSLLPKSSFINVFEGMYLALFDRKQACQMAQHGLQSKYVIVPFSIADSEGLEAFNPSSLADIYKFDKIANEVIRKNAGHKLVFCAGANPRAQTKAAFLLGCHLIMTHDLSLAECIESFSDLKDLFEQYAPSYLNLLSIGSCWQALLCAKQMGWIDFMDSDLVDHDDHDDLASIINMEEYLHYSR